ncbi:MAG TPA: metal-sensitive transcriptional regulator [Anaerolineales bacterium]|nr:metal-sensitive transcriptional regulator [Anaerolineales bacterium]
MSGDSPQFQTDLIRRLHCAEGHLHGIAMMIERGADCESVVHQTLAVQGALREINRLILRQHLDVCLREHLHEADDAAREKCLAEVVSLYQLLGAPAPPTRKERV